MNIANMLAAIDKEIERLEQARTLLSGEVTAPKPKKRNVTPEGRKRIVEAVRKRWAAQKKAAAK